MLIQVVWCVKYNNQLAVLVVLLCFLRLSVHLTYVYVPHYFWNSRGLSITVSQFLSWLFHVTVSTILSCWI